MTQGELVDILAVTVGLGIWPADLDTRPVRIEVACDCNRRREAIIIDLSRPRSPFRIFMGDPAQAPEVRPLCINLQDIPDGAAKGMACRLIEDFLDQYWRA